MMPPPCGVSLSPSAFVGNGIVPPGLPEPAPAQAAGLATAARAVGGLVAGPGFLEGHGQFTATAHDLGLRELDHGGDDADLGLGPGAETHRRFEGPIELGAA